MPIKIFERNNEFTWEFEKRINQRLSDQAAARFVRNVYPNPDGDSVVVWYEDRSVEAGDEK